MDDDGSYRRAVVGDLTVTMLVGGDGFESLLDVTVRTVNGETFEGTFATPTMIVERLARFAESGENAQGLYFWCSDLVVVRELNERTVVDTVRDLADAGLLASVFERSFPGEDGRVEE